MYAPQVGDKHAEGLHALRAEFYTEHLVMQAEIVSADARLSDHLNSSIDTIHVRPLHTERFDGTRIHINVTHASIAKAHLLFIFPLTEPETGSRTDNSAWMFTLTRPVWGAVGRYQISGKIHTEVGRDPRQLLRSFDEKQFFPITDGAVLMPDDSVRYHPTVLVNRAHMEILAI